MFDGLVGWQFRPRDGVREAEALARARAAKPAGLFDKRIIALTQGFLRDVLGSVNPHTGRSLAHDPTIA